MAKATVAEFILDRLAEWGVKRDLRLPGRRHQRHPRRASTRSGDRVEFIQTRHEELAAFAACAHAKFTGEVGVCMATSGPGAIHLLNGLYDAKLDHQPVVAIVGQQARMSLGADYQQEVDLDSLFKDVARRVRPDAAWSPSRRRTSSTGRCAIAQGDALADLHHRPQRRPGGAVYEEPPRAHGAVLSSPRLAIAAARSSRPRTRLRRAAEVLNAGEKVAMLIGQGAKGAAREVEQVADLLGAGVAKALNGRAVLPDDLPYVTGSIGLLGTKPSNDMMEGCDTLLMVGTSFPYSEWLPEPGPGARRADRHRRAG